MLKNRKDIMDLKFKFFHKLLAWFMSDANLDELAVHFHAFINHLNLPINKVIDCMEIKQDARGGFKKNLVLRHILINKNEKTLIEKYFASSGNIFQEEVILNDNIFYKFITDKAVRDKVTSKNNYYICDTEKVDDKTYYKMLRNKLIEECKEILSAKNNITLLEEISDLYAVIVELEVRTLAMIVNT